MCMYAKKMKRNLPNVKWKTYEMKWKLVFTPHHISINPSAIPYRNESNLRRIPFTSPALDISISITAASQHIRQSLSFLPNGSQSVGCQASSNVEITEGWLGWVVVCHTHIHISIISSLHPFIIRYLQFIYLFIRSCSVSLLYLFLETLNLTIYYWTKRVSSYKIPYYLFAILCLF